MTTGTPKHYDVAVIGAGIVGSAIARALSGFELSIAFLEARHDIGDGTSKANTAILHTGFDAKPGTLESQLVARGYQLLKQYAVETGIPVEPIGAILVAWDEEQLNSLPELKHKAELNGYQQSSIISAEEVYEALPHLGPGALGGLTVPDESIICTWTTNLALATEAVERGAELLLNHRVTAIEAGEEYTQLKTTQGTVRASWVINAAGLGSDTLDRFFGYERFSVTPRRGELIVYDKIARQLVDKIVLPVPSKVGKGVLVSPTIYGNVMLGPTAEDKDDKTDTANTQAGFDFLLEKGAAIMPELLDEEITATYAGLRAATEHNDFIIEIDAKQRYVVAGGIRSTGLTAGMSIAEHIIGLLQDTELKLVERAELPAAPHMPNIGENFTRPYQDAAKISDDPEYGRIVCFCERVTAGEIRDALASTIPPVSLDGIRRRTRAHNGRCQGFFCGAEIAAVLKTQSIDSLEKPGCCGKGTHTR